MDQLQAGWLDGVDSPGECNGSSLGFLPLKQLAKVLQHGETEMMMEPQGSAPKSKTIIKPFL